MFVSSLEFHIVIFYLHNQKTIIKCNQIKIMSSSFNPNSYVTSEYLVMLLGPVLVLDLHIIFRRDRQEWTRKYGRWILKKENMFLAGHDHCEMLRCS